MKIFTLFLSLSFITAASASDFPDAPVGLKFFGIDSDSGIQGPRYSSIVDELKDLQKTYPNLAQVHIYGRSHGQRPLALIKIADQQAKGKLPAVYIGGSIHGDEYLNIEDRLPRWFLEEAASADSSVARYLSNGGAIYLAPILNPDGYDQRSRTNDRRVDLNRDYTVRAAGVTGFKEPETASLISFLKRDLSREGRRLEVAMDYHCCIGALLYPWSFKGPVLPLADYERHKVIGEIMQTALGKDLKYGQTPVILGYSAKGTSKDFYYEEFGARGYTFEGRRGVEDRYFKEHTVMWSEILKLIR